MVKKWVGRFIALAVIVFAMIVTNKYFNTDVRAYEEAQAEQRAIWDQKAAMNERIRKEKEEEEKKNKENNNTSSSQQEEPKKKEYEPSEATGDDFVIDLAAIKSWESGEYSQKTGEKEDNKRRLRYPKLIEEECPKYNIILTEGYRLYICEYDEEKNFIRYEVLENGEVYNGSKDGAYFSITLSRIEKEKSLSYGGWSAVFNKGIEIKICTDKWLE